LLNLAANNIDATGVAMLTPGLAQRALLTSLSLSYNSIGEAGEASLALALSLARQTKLTSLNLYCNRLEPEGAAALAPSLT
jgi:Ran GTPase-activating protein (RanGAP) involved in mRNA processing and transport